MTDALLTAAMHRALLLAERGPAADANPRVGCVVLSPDGVLLGEGWHRGAGTAHAEVDALAHLPADTARGATVVVTLEPCAHRGRTGPCTEALIAAGVTRVVYAVDDPGALSGGGAGLLRDAGLEVESGLLAGEAAALLRDWLAPDRAPSTPSGHAPAAADDRGAGSDAPARGPVTGLGTMPPAGRPERSL